MLFLSFEINRCYQKRNKLVKSFDVRRKLKDLDEDKSIYKENIVGFISVLVKKDKFKTQ